MRYSHHERLSALDATFLAVEDANAHMHVGAVATFDAAPLRSADGATDIERVRRMVQVAIRRVPRYQQRLAWVPLFGYPVWVDDPRFNLHYHVRHVRLPKPGDDRQLKRLAGRIMSQQLDRGKPLWELWVVDGVEGDRVALITKAHHCMIDGVGSAELVGALMRATPELAAQLDDPPRWLARPIPTPLELLGAELLRRAAEPFAAARAVVKIGREPRRIAGQVRDAVAGVAEALAAGLQPASSTPFNVDIGAHRRFDWLATDLKELKAVKERLGGTLNDVVLAIVSGAVARYLHGRGMRVEDLDFRAMIPVNVRSEAERESLGNQVTMMVAKLPLGERDPRRRLERVGESVREVKRSRQALGVRTLEQVGDWTLMSVFTTFVRLSSSARPYNIIVTNIPGPQFPTYLLGSPMREVYPLVPLNHNQALGIALFSYDGKLFWGFNADWDVVTDLHDFVRAVEREVADLKASAPIRPVSAEVTNAGISPRRGARAKRGDGSQVVRVAAPRRRSAPRPPRKKASEKARFRKALQRR